MEIIVSSLHLDFMSQTPTCPSHPCQRLTIVIASLETNPLSQLNLSNARSVTSHGLTAIAPYASQLHTLILDRVQPVEDSNHMLCKSEAWI